MEIFGEDRPVTQQYGYRHMIAEFQILERYDADQLSKTFGKTQIARMEDRTGLCEIAWAKW